MWLVVKLVYVIVIVIVFMIANDTDCVACDLATICQPVCVMGWGREVLEGSCECKDINTRREFVPLQLAPCPI